MGTRLILLTLLPLLCFAQLPVTPNTQDFLGEVSAVIDTIKVRQAEFKKVNGRYLQAPALDHPASGRIDRPVRKFERAGNKVSYEKSGNDWTKLLPDVSVHGDYWVDVYLTPDLVWGYIVHAKIEYPDGTQYTYMEHEGPESYRDTSEGKWEEVTVSELSQ